MTDNGRIRCPWDWSSDRASRSAADRLHSFAAMWAEPYEQEPPRETSERDFFTGRLAEARQLQENMEAALLEGVRDARRYGASWTDVGDALGVSRQAAQQRFGGVK